jgi:hypothetical protein
MSHALATPRAFLFIGRLADLAALTAASPPHTRLFIPRPDGPTADAPTPKSNGMSRGGAENGGGLHLGVILPVLMRSGGSEAKDLVMVADQRGVHRSAPRRDG